MREHRIDHPHNEASAMIAVHNRRLLDAFGFDVAFWIACDETQAHKSLALLGRQRLEQQQTTDGDGDTKGEPWYVMPAKVKRSKTSYQDKTADTECMSRAGGWIYLIGSQYGSKGGPLDPKRSFVARFNESLVEVGRKKLKLTMDVACEPFAIHRAVNDALTHRGVELIPEGKQLLDALIRETLSDKDAAPWRDRIVLGDRPINIEGTTFLPNGRLLLGLRYPVSAGGHPILVEIDGIDRLFARDGYDTFGGIQATRVFVLENIGTPERPAGVRAMEQRGSTVHLITGDLDSQPEKSCILADHPEGANAVNEHHVFEMPYSTNEGVQYVKSTLIRHFEHADNVEGMSLFDNGTTWYVHDDECIRLDEASPEEANPAGRSTRSKKRSPAKR